MKKAAMAINSFMEVSCTRSIYICRWDIGICILLTRRTEKPSAADEIFSTGNTDRRIAARCRPDNNWKTGLSVGNEEVLSFIVELISNELN
jgi:hypothetical protein